MRQFIAFLVLLVGPSNMLLALEERLESFPEEMQIIRDVRGGEKGNTAAQDAWKTLSLKGARELPMFLKAIDGKNPLANNYFCSLVDAVAERALERKEKLPLDELESFLRNQKNDPRARRLAYELIVRADPKAADSLLPTMLDDPSLELRRDAVARVLESADKMLAKDKQDASASLFEKALKSARDEDQVKLASDKLKELGRKVDLQRHFGFVATWKLIGPFDNAEKKGFGAVYPPEEKLDSAAEYPGKAGTVKWIDHTTTHDYGKVDLNKALGKHMGAIAYATAEFHCDQPRTVDLRIGTDCANKIWLNGELVHSAEVYKALTKLDQYIAKGTLQPGRNVILLKICQNEMTEDWAQDWNFQCRVCDEVGSAILSEDHATVADEGDKP